MAEEGEIYIKNIKMEGEKMEYFTVLGYGLCVRYLRAGMMYRFFSNFSEEIIKEIGERKFNQICNILDETNSKNENIIVNNIEVDQKDCDLIGDYIEVILEAIKESSNKFRKVLSVCTDEHSWGYLVVRSGYPWEYNENMKWLKEQDIKSFLDGFKKYFYEADVDVGYFEIKCAE